MHTDPELLGLLALGEEVGTEDDRLHVETCAECAGELSQLHRLTALGRSLSPETTMVVPGQHVWANIRAELAFDPALELSAVPATSVLPETVTAPPPTVSRPAAPAESTAGHAGRALLAGVRAAISGLTQRSSVGAATAHAQLRPVGSAWSAASGTAELAIDHHGRRLLQVALQADLPPSGVRQAWLVHRDDPSIRQTLGILDGPHGLWTVEHSLDLEQYAILDISQQGTGETEHSGQTIVRGELTLVS